MGQTQELCKDLCNQQVVDLDEFNAFDLVIDSFFLYCQGVFQARLDDLRISSDRFCFPSALVVG